MVAALLGTGLLLWSAIPQGANLKLLSFAVYGFSLFALYLFSTLYHSSRGPWKARFRQLDHLAVNPIDLGAASTFEVFPHRRTRLLIDCQHALSKTFE